MHSLTISDRRTSSQPLWRRLGWSVYLASAGTFAAFLAFSFFLYIAAYLQAVRHKWAVKPGYSPNSVEYRQLIAWLFGSETLEAADVKAVLEGSDWSRPLTPQKGEQLQAAIGKVIRDTRVRAYWSTVILLVFFVIGLGYLLIALLRASTGGS